MTNNNLLTINVVTYNHEKYIAKCLDSLISQKTNFGYIIRIFEDCSTDNTAKICQEYAQKYPDKVFFYTNEKNLGDVLNAKKSYDNITTKYYMCIEGDDYCCDDNKFQIQVDILEQNPQYVFCSHQTLADNLNDKLLTEKSFKYSFIKEGPLSYKDFYVKHVICPNTHISSRIVRTEYINFVDYDPEIFMFDATQLLMLLEQGDMYYVDRIMTIYQQTGEGLYSGNTASGRLEHYIKRMLAYNEYSKGKINFVIYRTIAQYIFYIIRHIKEMDFPKDKKTKIKNYFMSPFMWEIASWPKRIKHWISYYLKIQT